MPGGRRRENPPKRIEEFEPLAAWFVGGLKQSGFENVNQLLTAFPTLASLRNALYKLAAAEAVIDGGDLRLVAGALGRPVEEALSVLGAAKLAYLKRRQRSDPKDSRIDSWDQIDSVLLSEVESLLKAQRGDVEQLPYGKLMVQAPPLTAVHVWQRMQPHVQASAVGRSRKPDDERMAQKRSRTGDRRLTSAAEALNQHEHVLITGKAGSGKSSFGHVVTAQLIDRWLGRPGTHDCPVVEPVLPLRLPARELVHDLPWGEELANAITRTLKSKLSVRMPPELLTRSVHRVRWLLFVDGLDEINDLDSRRKLINTIVLHARSSESTRFVVSTRSLDHTELAPLIGEGFGHYEMAEFRPEDLRVFATKWFREQRVGDGREGTETYLRQVADGRLRELVSNPLLATIAAIVCTRRPDEPLPTSRLGLYEEFCRFLLDDSPREHTTAGTELDRWLRANRGLLVEHLGRTRVENELPLLDAAVDWVRTASPHGDLPDDELVEPTRNALTDTGLFMGGGEAVRFLHHSFAEYLSGKGFAASFGDDVDKVIAWLRRYHRAENENLVVFTLALWNQRPGNDVSVLFERLAETGIDWVSLAGTLIAEGAEMPDDVVRGVVRRLGRRGLLNMNRSTVHSEIFSALSRMYENPHAAEFCHELIERPEQPSTVKVHAAIALAHIKGMEAVFPLLREHLGSSSLDDRIMLATAMVDQFQESTRQETVEILHEIDADLQLADDVRRRVLIAGKLQDLGDDDGAVRILHQLEYEWEDLSGSVETISRTLLRVLGDAAAEEMAADVIDAGPWEQSEMAAVLAQHGHRDEAMSLVRLVVTDNRSDATDLYTAFTAWIAVDGLAAEKMILEALRARTDLTASDRIDIAGKLAEAGATDVVAVLLDEILQDGNAREGSMTVLAQAWIKCHGRENHPELLRTARLFLRDYPEKLADVAQGLESAGCPEAVAEIGRELLKQSKPDWGAIGTAIAAWQRASGGSAEPEIDRLIGQQWQGAPMRDRASLSVATTACGFPFGRDLALSVLHDPGASAGRVANAVDSLTRVMGEAALPLIHAALSATTHVAAVEAITRLFYHCDEVDLDMFLPLVVGNPQTSSSELQQLADLLVRLTLRQEGITALRKFLADPDLAPRARTNASAVLAWLTYLDPAATSCGVPTCTGPHADSEAAPHP